VKKKMSDVETQIAPTPELERIVAIREAGFFAATRAAQ